MGRVCDHPCETACNAANWTARSGLPRFLGDEAIRRGWTLDPPVTSSGKRVRVVGAGPSGLSAAHPLRLRGHDAQVREAGPLAGGMMRFGEVVGTVHEATATFAVRRRLSCGNCATDCPCGAIDLAPEQI